MTFEVPGRFLSAFIKMADACRHTEPTAEQVAALLDDPRVDVVVALWRDPDASKGIGVWVAKGLPVLEAIIERGDIGRPPPRQIPPDEGPSSRFPARLACCRRVG